MLRELSGQDLTIVADPAEHLLISEKNPVSEVVIGSRPGIIDLSLHLHWKN